jgi:hypothetical protein
VPESVSPVEGLGLARGQAAQLGPTWDGAGCQAVWAVGFSSRLQLYLFSFSVFNHCF